MDIIELPPGKKWTNPQNSCSLSLKLCSQTLPCSLYLPFLCKYQTWAKWAQNKVNFTFRSLTKAEFFLLGATPEITLSKPESEVKSDQREATLTCTAKHIPVTDVLWVHERHGIIETTANKFIVNSKREDEERLSSTLTVHNVEAYDGGWYECRAGGVNSNRVVLQVQGMYVRKSQRSFSCRWSVCEIQWNAQCCKNRFINNLSLMAGIELVDQA